MWVLIVSVARLWVASVRFVSFGMATRDVFSEDQLARLRGFPNISQVELFRYYTLTTADEEFVLGFRRLSNVFGVAVQLCTLPWLGYVPDELTAAPSAAVARLSERLRLSAGCAKRCCRVDLIDRLDSIPRVARVRRYCRDDHR